MQSFSLKTFDYSKLKQKLSDHQRIAFAFVFGSARFGKLVRHDSDIDIAVWLTPPINVDDQLGMIEMCQNALQYDNIDLIVLNKASTLLCFEAISGIPLVINDWDIYVDFFSETSRYYEDQMILFGNIKKIMHEYKPGSDQK